LEPSTAETQHNQLMEKLDALSREIAALRGQSA